MIDHSLSSALETIESGPAGPEVGAYLDLDGTIVSGFTAAAFYAERIRKAHVGPAELARTVGLAVDSKLGGDMGRLGDVGVEGLRGQSEDNLRELGERLFAQKIGSTIRPQARQIVRAHQRKGHTVVMASSATHFQADPVAKDLGIKEVLCSQLETEDGLLTGRFEGHMLWGEAKARAARRHARERGIDLTLSHAYGNGTEDAAFLSSIGFPHPVNPHPGLLRIAENQGWQVLTLAEPGRRGIGAAASALAAIGGMNLGIVAGLGIGLLRRDPILGADLALSFGFQSYLGLAGVTLEVVGRQHLWDRRPCVFAMNHQSALDALIVGALTQGGMTALGKQEARYLPPTYLLGRALNTVWVDRTDPEAGRASQDKLVERLRDGYSVMIAPEGTRQPTPVLGPFKTGAFHVALEAGVPVVPIVLRNAHELMPGSAMTSLPGIVQVAVLDPIDTDGWKKSTIRTHAEEVRQRFAETLECWPSKGA